MHSKNTRMGLILFFIYLVYYVWFVLKNAFAPQSMEAESFGGLNAAVAHGFGLIIAAFVLAMIYGLIAKTTSNDESNEEGGSK